MPRRMTALSHEEMITAGLDPAEEHNYIATLVAAAGALGGFENEETLASWGIDVENDGGLLWIPGYGAPTFQFEFLDENDGKGSIRPLVARINRRLIALEDPYRVGDLWLLPHAQLDGDAAPVSLLGTEDSVLESLVEREYAQM